MTVHAAKTIQKQNRQTSSVKKQKGPSAFDQRKEASVHSHFQETANNSPQAKNLEALQTMANGKDGSLFHAIAALSTGGTLDEVNVSGGNNPGDATRDLGTTDRPQNAVAPRFQVNLMPIHNHPKRFSAIITKTQDADEGDVTSMYVKSGSYHTNFRWVPDNEILNQDMTPTKNRLTETRLQEEAVNWNYVYLNVSSSISKLSRDAEQEHLSDIREAYRISLGALDQAIDTLVNQMPLNGYAPRGGVGYKSALSAKNDMYDRINQLLPSESRGKIPTNQNQWVGEYLDLADMTSYRDHIGWHTFGVKESNSWENSALMKKVTEMWDIHAEHPETKIKYLDSVIGPNVKINQVPSNAVVHY